MDFIFDVLKIIGIAFFVALAIGVVAAFFSSGTEARYIACRNSALGKMKKFQPTEFHDQLAFDRNNGALAIVRSEKEGVRVLMIDPKSIIESECIINGQSRSVTKNNKSTLLRAAAGGVLLGPLGAVVGAISAQGDTRTVTDEVKEFKLRVSLDRPDVQMLMVKFFSEESVMLWNSFVNIAMRRESLIEESPPLELFEGVATEIESNGSAVLAGDISIREKLENLEVLKVEGFLSEAEYEQEKTKLLISG